MDDLINRQATYDTLTDYYHHTTDIQHKALCDALSRVPSAQPDLSDYSDKLWAAAYERGKAEAVRWILCGEEMPEMNTQVLLTIKGHDCIIPFNGENINNAIVRIGKERWVTLGFLGLDGWYGADGYPLVVQPIAWMQLLEPYKGEENK